MFCNNKFETQSRNVLCVNCICKLPHARQICAVKDEIKQNRYSDLPSKIFTLVFKNGNITTRRRSKDCNGALDVLYLPQIEKDTDSVQLKTDLPEIKVDLHYGMQRFSTSNTLNLEGNSDVTSGTINYRNSFYATLFSAVGVVFFITLLLAYVWKCRDKTSSSGINYVTQLEANTQNENRYSTMRGTDVQNVTVDETSHAYQVLAYHRYDEIDDIGHEYLELISQRRETTDPVLDVGHVLPGTERFCANAYAESLNA